MPSSRPDPYRELARLYDEAFGALRQGGATDLDAADNADLARVQSLVDRAGRLAQELADDPSATADSAGRAAAATSFGRLVSVLIEDRNRTRKDLGEIRGGRKVLRAYGTKNPTGRSLVRDV